MYALIAVIHAAHAQTQLLIVYRVCQILLYISIILQAVALMLQCATMELMPIQPLKFVSPVIHLAYYAQQHLFPAVYAQIVIILYHLIAHVHLFVPVAPFLQIYQDSLFANYALSLA